MSHNEMCGGMSYSGTASFEGKTVKEVLEEIKEFVKDKDAHYIGEGFGNKESKGCDCWGIYINYRYGFMGGHITKRYVGGWVGWVNDYNHEYDDYIVTQVDVSGGWYCYYDFTINCKAPDAKKKEGLSDEEPGPYDKCYYDDPAVKELFPED